MATFFSNVGSFFANPIKAAYFSILSSILSKFVDDFSSDNFDISIISGKVKFTNLKLKTDFLESLDLPISIKEGTLESLSLALPWTVSVLFKIYNGEDISSISMEPILLTIEKVKINISTYESLQDVYSEKKKKEFNLAEEIDAAIKKKLKLLQSKWNSRLISRSYRLGLTNFNLNKRSEDEETSAELPFSERIANVLLKFLHISIKQVHIQYEDTHSDVQKPFHLGAVLSSFYYGPCGDICCKNPKQLQGSSSNSSSAAGSHGSSPSSTDLPGGADPGAGFPHPSATNSASLHERESSSSSVPSSDPPSLHSHSASVPSSSLGGSNVIRFQHNWAQWDGLNIYLNSLAPITPASSESTNEKREVKKSTLPKRLPQKLSPRIIEQLKWTGLPLDQVSLLLADVSGAVKVTQQSLRPGLGLSRFDRSFTLPPNLASNSTSIELLAENSVKNPQSSSVMSEVNSQLTANSALASVQKKSKSTAETLNVADIYKSIANVNAASSKLLDSTSPLSMSNELIHVGGISIFDPPRLSIEVHVQGINISIVESQFVHILALSTYFQQYATFARYRRFKKPTRKFEKILNEEESQALHAHLDWRLRDAERKQKRKTGDNAVIPMPEDAPFNATLSLTPDPTPLPGLEEDTDLAGGTKATSFLERPEIDPVFRISPFKQNAIKTRATEWWRWAISCVRYDIALGVNTIKGSEANVRNFTRASENIDFDSQLKERPENQWKSRYVKLFKADWNRKWGHLLIPPMILPSFSVVSAPNAQSSPHPSLEWVMDAPSVMIGPAKLSADWSDAYYKSQAKADPPPSTPTTPGAETGNTVSVRMDPAEDFNQQIDRTTSKQGSAEEILWSSSAPWNSSYKKYLEKLDRMIASAERRLSLDELLSCRIQAETELLLEAALRIQEERTRLAFYLASGVYLPSKSTSSLLGQSDQLAPSAPSEKVNSNTFVSPLSTPQLKIGQNDIIDRNKSAASARSMRESLFQFLLQARKQKRYSHLSEFDITPRTVLVMLEHIRSSVSRSLFGNGDDPGHELSSLGKQVGGFHYMKNSNSKVSSSIESLLFRWLAINPHYFPENASYFRSVIDSPFDSSSEFLTITNPWLRIIYSHLQKEELFQSNGLSSAPSDLDSNIEEDFVEDEEEEEYVELESENPSEIAKVASLAADDLIKSAEPVEAKPKRKRIAGFIKKFVPGNRRKKNQSGNNNDSSIADAQVSSFLPWTASELIAVPSHIGLLVLTGLHPHSFSPQPAPSLPSMKWLSIVSLLQSTFSSIGATFLDLPTASEPCNYRYLAWWAQCQLGNTVFGGSQALVESIVQSSIRTATGLVDGPSISRSGPALVLLDPDQALYGKIRPSLQVNQRERAEISRHVFMDGPSEEEACLPAKYALLRMQLHMSAFTVSLFVTPSDSAASAAPASSNSNSIAPSPAISPLLLFSMEHINVHYSRVQGPLQVIDATMGAFKIEHSSPVFLPQRYSSSGETSVAVIGPGSSKIEKSQTQTMKQLQNLPRTLVHSEADHRPSFA
jgi:N-terminal region of Chorein or VPS13